jgi:hypothetical protein
MSQQNPTPKNVTTEPEQDQAEVFQTIQDLKNQERREARPARLPWRYIYGGIALFLMLWGAEKGRQFVNRPADSSSRLSNHSQTATVSGNPGETKRTGTAEYGATGQHGLQSSMEALGYTNITSEVLSGLSEAGVTSTYAHSIHKAGYPHISIDDLKAFKKLEITPEFITGFGAAGYFELSILQLKRLKTAGATPELARSLRKSAHDPLPSVDDILTAAGARN